MSRHETHQPKASPFSASRPACHKIAPSRRFTDCNTVVDVMDFRWLMHKPFRFNSGFQGLPGISLCHLFINVVLFWLGSRAASYYRLLYATAVALLIKT